MATMFVPRSVKRKKDITTNHSIKSNFPCDTDRKSLPTKVELANVGTSASSDSLPRKQIKSVIKSTVHDKYMYSSPADEEGDDVVEETVSYSKNQRWPTPGEPVCMICGRYGAYIVDETDKDVCSLECKARHLKEFTRNYKDEELLDQGMDSKESIETNSNDGVLPYSLPSNNEYKFHYKEHPLIAELSMSRVDDIRTNMKIKVKGNNISKPILEFQHCQLIETLNNNLSHFGYTTPTPVQMQVIPLGLSSRDVLACAPTGSGKTAAFLVPIIQMVYREIDCSFQNGRSLHLCNALGLILAPTRELCMQIEKQAKELIKGLPSMKTALIVGGLPFPPQLHRLYSGAQIIVATPGRMQEVLAKLGGHLRSIKILVLDEVDTMLQMGFEQQVENIIENLPKEKQMFMFSATIPLSIESMAAKMLVDPVYVSIGSPSAPNPSVKQIVMWVEDKSKKKHLFSILQDSRHFKPPVVIFVASKMGADLLAEAVQKVCKLSCLSVHGDKSQSERNRILDSFLCGEYSVLVCTALLGRGIDLPNVTQVINFDMPSSVDEYVHQVGRAGRLGSIGWAFTFINNTNKFIFFDMVETLQRLGVNLPDELLKSPYLLQQRQRRRESENKTKNRDTLVTGERLLDLIIKNSAKRKK